MKVFEFEAYKGFVNGWITEQPRGGHGQLRRMAHYVGVNSVVMSQVFRGDRDLTLEQALGLTKYMGLGTMERDYFLLLVQRDRAASHELKSVFQTQLQNLRSEAQKLRNRIKHQKFSQADQAIFYSSWYYSAVRLGVSIPELSSVGAIAEFLNLERPVAATVVEFLLKHKLVIEKEGCLDMGPQVTHVGQDSPFVNRHHVNWRMKSLQALEKTNEKNLFYTGPMALSYEAAAKIRNLIIELIEQATQTAAASTSETLSCLNVDWFGVDHS